MLRLAFKAGIFRATTDIQASTDIPCKVQFECRYREDAGKRHPEIERPLPKCRRLQTPYSHGSGKEASTQQEREHRRTPLANRVRPMPRNQSLRYARVTNTKRCGVSTLWRGWSSAAGHRSTTTHYIGQQIQIFQTRRRTKRVRRRRALPKSPPPSIIACPRPDHSSKSKLVSIDDRKYIQDGSMTNLCDPSTFDLFDPKDDSSATLDSFDLDFDDDCSASLPLDAFPDGDDIFDTSKGRARPSSPDLSHLMQEPLTYNKPSCNNKRVIITPTPVYDGVQSSIPLLSLPLPVPKRRRTSDVSSSSESSSSEENEVCGGSLAKLAECMVASAKTREMLLLHRRLINEGNSVGDKQVRAAENGSVARRVSGHLANRSETIEAFLSGSRPTLTDGLEQSRRQLNALGVVLLTG